MLREHPNLFPEGNRFVISIPFANSSPKYRQETGNKLGYFPIASRKPQKKRAIAKMPLGSGFITL
jgi:hypothetical protein